MAVTRGRIATGLRWAACVAAGVLLSDARATTVDAAAVPSARLDVLLTVAPDLPSQARGALLVEAARIWRREHVELHWVMPRGGTEAPSAPIRVLVIPRSEAAATRDVRWPVAELLPPSGRRALAVASIKAAERVVNEAARFPLVELPALAEHRLGLVLGRAVAHEIGHFLLATGTHAEHGLMRASVDADEFAAVGGDLFELDADASRWLRQRLHNERATFESIRADGFSYAPR
jgi:hypothetical protein